MGAEGAAGGGAGSGQAGGSGRTRVGSGLLRGGGPWCPGGAAAGSCTVGCGRGGPSGPVGAAARAAGIASGGGAGRTWTWCPYFGARSSVCT